MKNAELKERIQDAYRLERSERQTAFVKAHRQRELRLSELLLMQLRYMKPQCAAILLSLLCFLAFSETGVSSERIRLFSSFLPFLALSALAGLGGSQRCGMEELEMSARLSRRMLKALRLVIVGLAGLVTIVSVTCILNAVFAFPISAALLLAGVPYLLTTSACMMLIRKWHASENIYGCTAIAACVCVVSLSAEKCSAFKLSEISRTRGLALFAVTLLWAAWECKIYLKESEGYQWSLC